MKIKVKFVALINVETRVGYAYHVLSLKKETVINMSNNCLKDIPILVKYRLI